MYADPKAITQYIEGKRIQNVKVCTIQAVKDPALAKLIALAWEKGPADVAKWRDSLKKKK